MPKLSRMLSPTAEVSIPVPGDEPLIVEYRRQAATPRLLGRLADFQRTARSDADDLPGGDVMLTLCELYASVIVSWNLTDDEGNVLPTDAGSLADIAQSTLELIMDAIRAEISVNPQNSAVSSNGSSPMGSSAPVPITTGS